jgi:hypothetical protein
MGSGVWGPIRLFPHLKSQLETCVQMLLELQYSQIPDIYCKWKLH